MKLFYLIIVMLINSSLMHSQTLNGAWEKVKNHSNDQRTIKLYSDAYFTSSTYLGSTGEFVSASGGVYSLSSSDYIENYEINSESRAVTGTYLNFHYEVQNDTLYLSDKNSRNEEVWVKIDTADKENVTCWKIHQAFRDSKWLTIEDKPRKTLKMLTDNYYQILALNSQTGEFFGSSGGKWTQDDDKHNEIIQFFSKNPEMVGDTLSFKKQISEGIWNHNGKSSKGEYIQERWKRFK
ncbi:hypothetical protein [Psychroflexus tropicus]|uniref:hypothetical protein n=1 Tax=Psychroflexus tropicus TaxID=197345 RepID=UPI000363BC2F|nr:hypothetical protein [Psychroflexus tropicus]